MDWAQRELCLKVPAGKMFGSQSPPSHGLAQASEGLEVQEKHEQVIHGFREEYALSLPHDST